MKNVTGQWLDKLCSRLQGVSRAVVFSPATTTRPAMPIVCWPQDCQDFQFGEIALKAVASLKRAVVLRQTVSESTTGEPHHVIVCPLFLQDELHAIATIEISIRTPVKQQAAIRQVEEAASWFETVIEQKKSTNKSHLVTAVEMMASCLEYDNFSQAAIDVVTELATRLDCERVSVGFLSNKAIRVEAVSHSSSFDNKSKLVQDISEAIYEAVDQDSVIVYPEETESYRFTRCHGELAAHHNIDSILTIPFAANGKMLGGFLFERRKGEMFDQSTIHFIQQLTALVGPVLEIRFRDDQSFLYKVRKTLLRSLGRVFGPEHLGLKLTAGIVIFVLGLLSVIKTEYKVACDARLEPLAQRVVVAPQKGFIADALVRAGDIVKKGDVLGSLEDKDLQLEYTKWASQLHQTEKEYRDALAQHDRSRVNILRAKLQQAKAQLELISEQLARIQLAAPFDGVIVSGDLSQSLGAPVERGEVLFTIAPLNGYRVMSQVDERDIGEVRTGLSGTLILSGVPHKPLTFVVKKITPVSVTEEGRNYFQVEAVMDDNSGLFRPGMTGIAKISVERRRVIWILTHKLVDWLRLSLWSFKI